MVQDHADGSYTCTFRDDADIRRAVAMEAGIDKIDVADGEATYADMPREAVHMRGTGERRVVPAHIVDQTKHKFGASPRATFGPPRGGWPEFGPDGKVVG